MADAQGEQAKLMILGKASVLGERFGSGGDTVEASSEAMGGLFYYQEAPDPGRSHIPVKARRLARVAMLASPRVYEGFCWHNACHELTPWNWKTLLGATSPDYMLVESCIHDSSRSWSRPAYDPQFVEQLGSMARHARKEGIPTIFWHTLGKDMAQMFVEGMRAFDIVACADSESVEEVKKYGINARLLPWAFSPEQFHPLGNFRQSLTAGNLLFDGMARMLRFGHVQENLVKFTGHGLDVIDTGMLVPPYNLERFHIKDLSGCARGNVSQNLVQEFYKNAGALLSLEDAPGLLAPGQRWRNLEAAACRCPVLHYSALGEETGQFADITEIFYNIDDVLNRWADFITQPMEREKAAHSGWRKAHASHTFAHRMDLIHSWIGHGAKALENPKATIVVPTMRPENLEHVLKQYERQNWPNKELAYVFNGPRQKMPALPQRPDIRVINVPQEYSTGMVMNAGIGIASGEYVFRFDDDDLYGDFYVADRMIHFREFDLQIISNASSYVTFGDSGEAFLLDPEDNKNHGTVFALGNAAYGVAGFTGGSVAMSMEYARGTPFQEQTYACTDVATLIKGIVFTPAARYAKIDGMNFCVRRNAVEKHTWSASREEVLGYTNGCPVPLEAVFI